MPLDFCTLEIDIDNSASVEQTWGLRAKALLLLVYLFYIHRLARFAMKSERLMMVGKRLAFAVTLLFGALVMVFAHYGTVLAQTTTQGSQVSMPAEGNRYACEDDLIEVIFEPDRTVRLRQSEPVDLSGRSLSNVLSLLASKGPVEWRRSCDVPEEILDEMQAVGEQNSGQTVYNLNNIYRVRLGKGHDLWGLCSELEALPEIMWARPVPKPMLPPMIPPPYDTGQGYLRPASTTPKGIDAAYAWTQTGGTGSGVTICDLEYSWNYNHADISKAVGSQINSNVSDPFDDLNHGTAVIGILVADNNGWGTTGVCYGANLKTCGTYYGSPTPEWNVAGAIALAVANLNAGDVILLEQQWEYNGVQNQFIPIEWWGDVNNQTWNPVFTAIVNAVTNGIHVVEAGGNGAYNTDILGWHPNGSGAIIVGAGGVYAGGTYVEGDLQRLSFSSYGVRYDLQGWGENVVTTGYGDLYSADGDNYTYTNTFAGTSSASPIVAGAVACCVGRWKGVGGAGGTLRPAVLLSILKNTATPQVTPPTGNIGGRPNLLAAFPYVSTAPEWNDVTPRILSRYGSIASSSWPDYDNDGDFDLFLAQMYSPDSSHLFRNDGGSFVEVTPSNLDTAATGVVGAWGDYDNDGDVDIYVSRNDNRANKLYRNNGGGSFTDVSGAPINDANNGSGAAWIDYDTDGDLDLYLSQLTSANKLFRNDGGMFVDVTSGPVGDTLNTSMSIWADYDTDNDPDLFITNFNGPNKLLRNDGGTFTDVTPSPLAIASHSYSADWGDYDNDGDLDLFVAVYWSNLPDKLFRNDGGGAFTDVTPVSMTNWDYTQGCAWGDYDNDGDLDIYVTNGANEANKLYRNNGGGNFAVAYNGDLISPLTDNGCYGRGGVWADYDRDGDLDLYLSNTYGSGCRSRLFRNEVGDNNHWLQAKLVGTISNKNSIGARVRIVAGGKQQIREISTVSGGWNQSPPIAAFGLGSTTVIDSLIARWPSDTVRIFTAVPVDTFLTIYETEPSYTCGDANGDDAIDISDAVFLISYIFSGGSAPDPLEAGDANCDAAVDISDAVYLISFIFSGGAAPCAFCK